jgi:hypothetical protein
MGSGEQTDREEGDFVVLFTFYENKRTGMGSGSE